VGVVLLTGTAIVPPPDFTLRACDELIIATTGLGELRTILIATPSASVTSRNLQATGKARLGIGPTRDLIMIEGTVHAAQAATDIPPETGDAFAAKTGFDPRELTSYLYFHIRPQRIQAWREANELPGRELMRSGQWAI